MQALSEEDRRLWMEAMDGREPVSSNFGPKRRGNGASVSREPGADRSLWSRCHAAPARAVSVGQLLPPAKRIL